MDKTFIITKIINKILKRYDLMNTLNASVYENRHYKLINNKTTPSFLLDKHLRFRHSGILNCGMVKF